MFGPLPNLSMLQISTAGATQTATSFPPGHLNGFRSKMYESSYRSVLLNGLLEVCIWASACRLTETHVVAPTNLNPCFKTSRLRSCLVISPSLTICRTCPHALQPLHL